MNNKRARKINAGIVSGKLGASLWKLSLPMMAGMVLQNLFSLADLFFVGRLGHIAVAALSMSGVVISVVMMAAIGISSGTTALIAHFTGKKDYKSADNVLFQAIVLSVICSLVMVIIGIFGIKELLHIFGATNEIIPSAYGYLKIGFVSSIVIFLFIAFNQALRGSGDAVTPLKILILSNLINIILDPLFIFGYGFLPRMGVAGSALATVISRAIGVFILLRHFIFGYSSLHFRRDVFKINFLLIGRMIKIGFFASLEIFLRQMSLLFLIWLVTSFGNVCLAAYGIGIRLRMVVMMIGFGMGTASSVLIGQNMGAGNPERAEASGFKALKYYEFIIVPFSLLFLIFSPEIVGIFVHNKEVIKMGSDFLRFIAVALPFLASALILSRGIAGAGDTVAFAVMTAIAQLGLRVPLAYALVILFKSGSNGIWTAISVSDVAGGLMMLWYFKKGSWKKKYYRHRAILEAGSFVAA